MDDQTWTVGAAITAVTLPTATGGDGTVTYALTPGHHRLRADADQHRVDAGDQRHADQGADHGHHLYLDGNRRRQRHGHRDLQRKPSARERRICPAGGVTRSLTFGEAAPSLPTITQTPATGGGTLQYASSSAVCTIDIDGGNLAIAQSGACQISVTILGNSNYEALTIPYDVAYITVSPAAPNVSATPGDGDTHADLDRPR